MRPLRIAMTGAAAVLTLAAALIPAHSAMAAVTGSFDPSVVSPGGTIVVTGSGCPVASEVVVSTWITSLGSTLKSTSVTADAAGEFSATVAVHGAPGELPEITPPHSQFAVNVQCGGVDTVFGYGRLSYPGSPLSAVPSPTLAVVPGDDVTISGAGCDAGESVFIAVWFAGASSFLIDDTAADASGGFTFVVPTPADGPSGGVISLEFTCGGPVPVDDPADYLRLVMFFVEAAIDPVDPVDPVVPVDPIVPADPGPGAAPAATVPTPLPTARRAALPATGPDLGFAGAALAFLLAGATLVGLRRSRWNADRGDRSSGTAR